MKLPSMSFWKGFAWGGLLSAVLVSVLLNFTLRTQYALSALTRTSNTNAAISVLIDHGHLERAQDKLRFITWFNLQTGRFENCMSEQPYLLWFSTALETCRTIWDERMPEDWEIPWKHRITVNEQGHLESGK